MFQAVFNSEMQKAKVTLVGLDTRVTFSMFDCETDRSNTDEFDPTRNFTRTE